MPIWKDCLDPTSPFHIEGASRQGRWIITCDHATNRVPEEIGDLGIPAADMARHIAYDPGSIGVARRLGHLLESPVISSNFSRLVIDPNRGRDDPTRIMQIYDGTIIPANRGMSAAAAQHREDAYYRAYDDALALAYDARPEAAVVSIHSFTPRLNGKAMRPWQVGILFASDTRLSTPLIDEISKDQSLTVGANEPYSGHLPGDAIDRHALRLGRHNTLIELRNDLIADDAGQEHWAQFLALRLENALNRV